MAVYVKEKTILSADKMRENVEQMCTAGDVEKEKKGVYDAEHWCITRQCVAEY